MVYLTPSEFAGYGVEPATPAAVVAAMSALIEAHCRRPTLAPARYVERLRMASGASAVRASYLPLTAVAPATSPLVSLRARYAQPRRGDTDFACQHELYAEVATVFGLPGQWTEISLANLDYDSLTGEISVPGGALQAPFNEVEITYTAGLDPISDAVKHACASLIRNAQATPALNLRLTRLDSMQLEYFSQSLVDDSVRRWLAPYVAQKAG